MSLRVWLPLTKDLRNQGLDDVTVTNNGATFNSAGKLGGCYTGRIDVSSSIIPTILNGSEFTVAFWIYINEVPTGSGEADTYVMACGTGGTRTKFHIAIRQNGAGFAFCFYSDDYTFYNTVTDKVEKWMHVVCAFKNNTQIVYVDGVKVGERATAGGLNVPANSVLTIYAAHERLNDVRLYDHCLSSMEVKELSKGLVLHYPLNRGGWGQENLLVDTYNWSTLTSVNTVSEGYWYSNGGTAVRGYDNINNITYCKIWHSDNSSWTRYSRQYITMQPNTYYTVSILCRINTDIAHLSIRNDRNEAITFFASNVELTNKNWEWKFFTAKTHTNTSQEPFTIYAQVNSDGVLSSDTSIDIAMVKLEKGSIATPWCPNLSDALATTMGLNDNVEYDCSGFGNNGIRTGTFSWTSDAPKYEVSTYMPATAIITHNRCLDNTNQEWSCAAWVKPKVAGNYQNLNNFNESNRLYHGTYPLLYINSGTNDYYNYGNLALPANQWSHIVFVFKNSTGTKLIYINGENHTNTNGPNKTSTPKGIPDNVIIGSGNYEGGLCDYREYATALSADDVKSLYNNSAYIDNQGNIYGAVYEEV